MPIMHLNKFKCPCMLIASAIYATIIMKNAAKNLSDIIAKTRETNRSHKRVSTLLGNVKKMHHFDENDKRVVKRYKFYKICITFDRHACQRCIPLKIRISRRVRQQKQKLCVVVQVASFDDAFLLLRHTPKRCITCII